VCKAVLWESELLQGMFDVSSAFCPIRRRTMSNFDLNQNGVPLVA